jgi:hypothetical protein
MNTTANLSRFIGKETGIIFAALSGITYVLRYMTLSQLTIKWSSLFLSSLSLCRSREDVQAFASVGASAVLVGETLMRSSDPGVTIKQLLGVPTAGPTAHVDPLIKVGTS